MLVLLDFIVLEEDHVGVDSAGFSHLFVQQVVLFIGSIWVAVILLEARLCFELHVISWFSYLNFLLSECDLRGMQTCIIEFVFGAHHRSPRWFSHRLVYFLTLFEAIFFVDGGGNLWEVNRWLLLDIDVEFGNWHLLLGYLISILGTRIRLFLIPYGCHLTITDFIVMLTIRHHFLRLSGDHIQVIALENPASTDWFYQFGWSFFLVLQTWGALSFLVILNSNTFFFGLPGLFFKQKLVVLWCIGLVVVVNDWLLAL